MHEKAEAYHEEFKGPLQHYQDQLDDSLEFIRSRAEELAEWAPYVDWGERLAGILCTDGIKRAFKSVSRYDFMPDEFKAQTAVDKAFQIGHGQTISQPSTVALMLEGLQVKRSNKVLDIGSGSGWTTALMAHITGRAGTVIGLERIPELVEFGKKNLAKYQLPAAEIKLSGEELGLEEEAPFHRILVSAHAPQVLIQELKYQLNPRGGRLVAPIIPTNSYGSDEHICDIVAVTRDGKEFEPNTLAREYSFVPLIDPDDRFSP